MQPDTKDKYKDRILNLIVIKFNAAMGLSEV